MNADLHSHSIMSDGLLKPAELVQRAHAHGVDLLALTDHDELAGLDEARATADALGMCFVNGVEISVSWGRDHTIHIVGLGVDPDYAVLDVGLAQLRGGRDARARQMAAELDKVGIHGAYEGALRFAGNPAMVGRSHFARYIVEAGHARDVKSVFDHWLAKDKPGYVPHQWTSLSNALDWIHRAGGVAVVAHPGRYRITRKELRSLLAEFCDLGGEGIEVLSGSHSAEDVAASARHAREFGLLASRGSDFHGPGESRVDLGRLPALPEDLSPIWQKLV
ncbi:MAG: PHP domain-containing protein [Sterolibacterium sp.]|nr:PHP domain-containing protein [Sterolibacterium sp.]